MCNGNETAVKPRGTATPIYTRKTTFCSLRICMTALLGFVTGMAERLQTTCQQHANGLATEEELSYHLRLRRTKSGGLDALVGAWPRNRLAAHAQVFYSASEAACCLSSYSCVRGTLHRQVDALLVVLKMNL